MNYGSGVDWIRQADPYETKKQTIMGYNNKDIDEGIVVDGGKVSINSLLNFSFILLRKLITSCTTSII